MGTLFRDVWLWCLLSFLLGALITWAVMRATRKPKVEVTEERLSGPAMGDRMNDQMRDPMRDPARDRMDDRTGATAATAATAGAAGAGMAAAGRDTSRMRDAVPGMDTSQAPDASRGSEPMRGTATAGTTGAAGATGAAGTTAGRAGAAGAAGMAGAAGAAAASGSRAATPPGDKATAMAGSGSAMRMVQPGDFPGSARSNADGSAPSPEYTVKGNAQTMLYHTPDSPSYRDTRAEVWFKSTIEAERAGFVAWNKNPRDARSRRA